MFPTNITLVSYQENFYPELSVMDQRNIFCIVAQYSFSFRTFLSTLLSLSVADGLKYLPVSVTHYSCAEHTVLSCAASANKRSNCAYARFA